MVYAKTDQLLVDVNNTLLHLLAGHAAVDFQHYQPRIASSVHFEATDPDSEMNGKFMAPRPRAEAPESDSKIPLEASFRLSS